MSSAPLFNDRLDAGKQLAQSVFTLVNQLKATGISASPIVYTLPRGGIPTGEPVARLLNCPLDIIVAKKIAIPPNPELAIGAVTSLGHVLWVRPKFLEKYPPDLLEAALRQAQEKAQAQAQAFSSGRPDVSPQGALALLVDDGIATGMTMAAATQALKAQNPAQIWICAPVAPASLLKWLTQWCDRVVILETHDPFLSVSRFYAKFPQVETEEALVCLQQYNHSLTAGN